MLNNKRKDIKNGLKVDSRFTCFPFILEKLLFYIFSKQLESHVIFLYVSKNARMEEENKEIANNFLLQMHIEKRRERERRLLLFALSFYSLNSSIFDQICVCARVPVLFSIFIIFILLAMNEYSLVQLSFFISHCYSCSKLFLVKVITFITFHS